jgi:hypothetical protein
MIDPLNAASPNPRLQRTPLRAPLSRKPLGSVGYGVALVSVIMVVSLQACASGQGGAPPWCPGQAVDFGVKRVHGLLGTLSTETGPVVGAPVRWRPVGPGSSAPPEWQFGGTDQTGRFFASDLAAGRWELQLCPQGYRPIRGVIQIDDGSPVESVALYAQH